MKHRSINAICPVYREIKSVGLRGWSWLLRLAAMNANHDVAARRRNHVQSMNRQNQFYATLVIGLLGFSLAVSAPAASPPNIIVILADDLGYGSVGCYGANPGLIRTPNIDRLAREGMRFTDAYATGSVCSPTRYAMITGRYCWRSSLNSGAVVNTFDPLIIEPERPTVASLLKSKGYATAMIGKWHLGYGAAKRTDYTKELIPGPLELGFDYQFAVPQNHNDVTRAFVEDHKVFGLRSAKLTPSPGNIGLDAPQRDDPKTEGALADRAVAWLEKQTPDKPFFLHFAPIAVHEKVTPSAESSGTSKAGPYGDFIHDLDRSVGRILDTLDRLKLAENTLVFVTSDNGGVLGKPGSAERQAAAAGLKINGIMRGGKHDVWEGGFRVPLIARWPGRIQPASISEQVVGSVDYLATVASLVKAPLPPPAPDAAGPDSYNFLPALLGTAQTPIRPQLLLQSAKGVYAVRQGPWKLISSSGGIEGKDGKLRKTSEDPGHSQLFNLKTDPSEQHDVSAEHPEIVLELTGILASDRARGYSRK
jgi:arylsulfatase A-like enzyme